MVGRMKNTGVSIVWYGWLLVLLVWMNDANGGGGVNGYTITNNNNNNNGLVSNHHLNGKPASRRRSSTLLWMAAETKSGERAGTAGYSVLRQPLTWNKKNTDDPMFDVPLFLDQDNASANINNEYLSQRYISRSSSSNNVPDDDDSRRTGGLDLNERTTTSLDYPQVLKALKEECRTLPAQQLVDDQLLAGSSLLENNNDDDDYGGAGSKEWPYCGLRAQSAEESTMRYEALQEYMNLLENNSRDIPTFHNQLNMTFVPFRHPSSKNKNNRAPPTVLNGLQIQTVYQTFQSIHLMSQWIQTQIEKYDGDDSDSTSTSKKEFNHLHQLTHSMDEIPPSLRKLLDTALEEQTSSNNNNNNDKNDKDSSSTYAAYMQNASPLITYKLSGTTFPKLKLLRDERRMRQQSILQLLDSLRKKHKSYIKMDDSDSSGNGLFSQVNGRVVLPMASTNVMKGGTIHDVSRSGQTAYVEPPELIKSTDQLQQLEQQLQAEEAQIWRNLTLGILEHETSIQNAIAASSQIDLLQAKITLGQNRMMSSSTNNNNRYNDDDPNNYLVIPQVSNQGVIHVKQAKHPVLLLRQHLKQRRTLPAKYYSSSSTESTSTASSEVVANDVQLGANDENCGLILTGPNSGGKTIILKLVGLLAFMARDGLLIPATKTTTTDDDDDEPPTRIDFFHPILADIGDIQSVDDELSTFSGHMLVCKQVLDQVNNLQNNEKCNALVLMDELGSGTDPQQGVAIAQALLEALLEAQARIVITTHYMELKQLASTNPKFAVGGMQFRNGRPTYKLLPGVVGESYALAVAERLQLPTNIINRAKELMNAETRQMGELIQDLEQRKNDMEEQQSALAQQQEQIQILKKEMELQQQELERRQLQIRREEAEKYAATLQEKEAKLKSILDKMQADPSKKIVAKSWDNLRAVKRDVLKEVDQTWQQQLINSKNNKDDSTSSQQAELIPLSQLSISERNNLNVGDEVIVCKKGSFYSKRGKIVSMGKLWNISFNGMGMSMKLADLALPPSLNSPVGASISKMNTASSNAYNDGGPKLSKMARKALADEEHDMEMRQSNSRKGGNNNNDDEGSSLRLTSNTIDVLGCNFEEAKRKCEDTFAKAMTRKNTVVYILHGHGAQGVLKQKLRDWLRRDRQWVSKFKAADKEDGGDAFTQVVVKKIKF